MFKDYYQILGILSNASADEIKTAYRKMSLKWHPDRNAGVDVTKEMQDINEAYAILKDRVKRLRYDSEYTQFVFVCKQNKAENANSNPKSQEEEEINTQWSYDYNVKDENLKEDIKDARQYAKELVEEFMKSFKSASKAAVKGATKNVIEYTVGWVIGGVFIIFIGALIKTCN